MYKLVRKSQPHNNIIKYKNEMFSLTMSMFSMYISQLFNKNICSKMVNKEVFTNNDYIDIL